MNTTLDNIFGFSELGILQKRNIPKNTFYKQDSFNTARKRLFTDHIEKIELIAICDKNTTNIQSLENEERIYKEIFFIYISLREDRSKHKKIADAVHHFIPNPVVIIFTCKSEFCVSVAHKRLSKQEKGEVVVENIYSSPWIDLQEPDESQQKFLKKLHLKNFRFDSFFTLYDDILKAVICSTFIELIGEYLYSKRCKRDELEEHASDRARIEEEIRNYTKKEKELSNFGDKVANHESLLKAQKVLQDLKKDITNTLHTNHG